MASVEGLDSVLKGLQDLATRHGTEPEVKVVVGYAADYAQGVHERLDVNHPIGQAKYLEQPALELRDEIRGVVTTAISEGKTLREALLAGGLFLQHASQLLVPYRTGFLYDSAYTRLEEGR